MSSKASIVALAIAAASVATGEADDEDWRLVLQAVEASAKGALRRFWSRLGPETLDDILAEVRLRFCEAVEHRRMPATDAALLRGYAAMTAQRCALNHRRDIEHAHSIQACGKSVLIDSRTVVHESRCHDPVAQVERVVPGD